MPTKKEITAEVKALKKMKPNIRERTAFGEDNQAAIDAQINVLENDMGDDAIYDQYGGDDEEETDANRHELDNALEARRWLDGDKGKPSDNWKSLVQK